MGQLNEILPNKTTIEKKEAKNVTQNKVANAVGTKYDLPIVNNCDYLQLNTTFDKIIRWSYKHQCN